MAPRKSPRKPPSTPDARSRSRGRDEWSCSVCTLLNNWRERRCGACDSERPVDADSQPTEWTCGVCTLVNEWVAERCAACEQERPAPTAASGAQRTCQPHQPPVQEQPWSEAEPRQSGPAVAASPVRPTRKRALSTPSKSSSATPRPYPEIQRSPPSRSRLIHATNEATAHASASFQTVEDATENMDGLPEAPTFNLLAFMAGSVPHPVEPQDEERAIGTTTPPHSTRPSSPVFDLLNRPTVDLTETAGDENTTMDDSETKLTRAGLRLSDSESDGDEEHGREQRFFRRRRSLQSSLSQHTLNPSTQDRHVDWDCPVCTHSNRAFSASCELCKTRRNESNHNDHEGSERPAEDTVECPVCTHMNAKSAGTCDVCNTVISGDQSNSAFTCVVCTNINPAHLDQCEMCETKRRTVACPVCTTLNAIDRRRCEVCESIIDPQSTTREFRSASDTFIDLEPSQSESEQPIDRFREDSFDAESRIDQESVGDFDDDFDDRNDVYTTTRRPNTDYTSFGHNRHRHDIEDISDNEIYGRIPVDNQQPPQSRLPELREFEHFLSVDDTRLDYQCQIDYRSMFAESSRSRSYADRLQKRRRESQKRKRAAAENPKGLQQSTAGRAKTSGKRKAPKASNKKAKATERRGSTGRSSATRASKPRKEAKPRRSSAPAFAGGINHYDAVDEDFGDDVTTMAWEGVGSAGYF